MSKKNKHLSRIWISPALIEQSREKWSDNEVNYMSVDEFNDKVKELRAAIKEAKWKLAEAASGQYNMEDSIGFAREALEAIDKVKP